MNELAKTDPTLAALAKASSAQLPEGYDTLAVAGESRWANFQDPAPAIPEGAMNDKTILIPNVVEGLLLGMEDLEEDENGEVRSFYNVRLLRPALCSNKSKKEPFIVEAGEVIQLGNNKRLQDLEKLVSSGGKWLVFIHGSEKLKLAKGKTMWSFNIGKLLLEPPPAPEYEAPTND